MENLVTIKEVGAYSERQYQRQDGTTEGRDLRGDDRGVCVEEPRCTVLSEPAVYREGLLEAPHMAGPEPADTARECVLYHGPAESLKIKN